MKLSACRPQIDLTAPRSRLEGATWQQTSFLNFHSISEPSQFAAVWWDRHKIEPPWSLSTPFTYTGVPRNRTSQTVYCRFMDPMNDGKPWRLRQQLPSTAHTGPMTSHLYISKDLSLETVGKVTNSPSRVTKRWNSTTSCERQPKTIPHPKKKEGDSCDYPPPSNLAARNQL